MQLNKILIASLTSILMLSAAPYQTTTTTKKSAAKAARNATPEQIAAAKSSGQVWVNLFTKVYHDSSSEFYGATKAGKFMTEKDAIAAGYHKSKIGNE